MAKGLRSSVKKANKARLRAQVFQPVEVARKERLSAKLLELATQAKEEPPQDGSGMDVDHREAGLDSANSTKRGEKHPESRPEDGDEKMRDSDSDTLDASAASLKRKEGRKAKRGRRKLSSSAVFPVWKKGVRVGGRSRITKRK